MGLGDAAGAASMRFYCALNRCFCAKVQCVMKGTPAQGQDSRTGPEINSGLRYVKPQKSCRARPTRCFGT